MYYYHYWLLLFNGQVCSRFCSSFVFILLLLHWAPYRSPFHSLVYSFSFSYRHPVFIFYKCCSVHVVRPGDVCRRLRSSAIEIRARRRDLNLAAATYRPSIYYSFYAFSCASFICFSWCCCCCFFFNPILLLFLIRFNFWIWKFEEKKENIQRQQKFAIIASIETDKQTDAGAAANKANEPLATNSENWVKPEEFTHTHTHTHFYKFISEQKQQTTQNKRKELLTMSQ